MLATRKGKKMPENEKVKNEVERLKEMSEALEQERIEKAKAEIEAILTKYGVKLEAYARIPAAEIKIVVLGR